jgi:ATP-dependent RNA helicase RhlE
LMDMEIDTLLFPEEVAVSKELTPDERPKMGMGGSPHKLKKLTNSGEAFHEKKEKNMKENLGGSYKREIEAKYKKAKTRGDKNANRRNKK